MNRITGTTQLIGLLGWPVSHSLSPQMHNAASAALNLDLAYLPLPVESQHLQAAVAGLVAQGFLGANVTVPHKQAVVPLMDRLDRPAAVIGAVNTIVISRQARNGGLEITLTGYNTDWEGFILDLEELGWDPAGKNCLLLGAGGSARAVAYGLAGAGAAVTVTSRRVEQARSAAADIGQRMGGVQLYHLDWGHLDDHCQEQAPDLIVNTTPVGMAPAADKSPWPRDLQIPSSTLVYDLVYQPARTRFLRDAESAGCQVANGLGMLVQQGALSFKLWTGLKPDLPIMAGALE